MQCGLYHYYKFISADFYAGAQYNEMTVCESQFHHCVIVLTNMICVDIAIGLLVSSVGIIDTRLLF